MGVVPELGSQLNDDPDANGHEAHGSNEGHDLLDVGNILGASDQGCSTAKEGVDSGGVHHGLALTLLHSGSRESNVARELLGG